MQAGVRLVSPSVSISDSRRNVALARELGYLAMVGEHPWYAGDDPGLGDLAALAQDDMVVGIGECGLDARRGLPLEGQVQRLEAQLSLAAELGLPVSLHVRGWHNELLSCLRRYHGRISGVLHGFVFSRDLARRYLDEGLILGLGHLTPCQGRRLREAVPYAGAGRIVLETDLAQGAASYPVDLLERILGAAAGLLGMAAVELGPRLERNFLRVFLREVG